ncbi:FecR family protein [Mesorhizobium retamae]|uniref:FecR domain-containing protein n=1 Tax=Mesorhizobium retamae TaxID=2912854 RepID=A0ABS9QF92_9HYPH|nr:FecR domain-containing protein [Mesorhizobium sp. IRAMC:0171]
MRIVRLHSGEAGENDWAEFRRWRSTSAEHEAAAAEAELLWNDASNLHRDPRTGLIKPGRRKPVSRRAVLGGIGAAALALGGLRVTGALQGILSDHTTGTGQTSVIDLPDGSRAYLNAASALNIDFSPQRRSAELVGGQAYFEVVGDPLRRPFDVKAGDVTASALGTAFDVNRNLPDGATEITVTEHMVRVTSVSASQEIVLDAGETVIVSRDGHAGPVTTIEKSAAVAWRSGLYVAESRSLAQVVAALQAYHEGWLVIEDDKARLLRVNAVLDLRTPASSLDALASGLPIRIRRLSRFLTVISSV